MVKRHAMYQTIGLDERNVLVYSMSLYDVYFSKNIVKTVAFRPITNRQAIFSYMFAILKRTIHSRETC